MILVDSDVLIEHLRGSHAARRWLLDARHRTGPLAVSGVSVAEVLGGMRSAERSEVARLFAMTKIVAADDAVGRAAGELRRRYHQSHGSIGIADYLIAATATVHGCELATLNVKHFPMCNGLVPPFPV